MKSKFIKLTNIKDKKLMEKFMNSLILDILVHGNFFDRIAFEMECKNCGSIWTPKKLLTLPPTDIELKRMLEQNKICHHCKSKKIEVLYMPIKYELSPIEELLKELEK